MEMKVARPMCTNTLRTATGAQQLPHLHNSQQSGGSNGSLTRTTVSRQGRIRKINSQPCLVIAGGTCDQKHQEPQQNWWPRPQWQHPQHQPHQQLGMHKSHWIPRPPSVSTLVKPAPLAAVHPAPPHDPGTLAQVAHRTEASKSTESQRRNTKPRWSQKQQKCSQLGDPKWIIWDCSNI